MSHRVRAGKLRHRLNLMAVTETPDGLGGVTTSYALLASVWGSIERVSETERLNAGMLQNVITHKIRIRQIDGLSVSDRVDFGSRQFEIVELNDVEERSYVMELRCMEVSPT